VSIPSSGSPRFIEIAVLVLDCAKLERTFGVRLPAWQEGVAACVARLVKKG
jgi:dTDP-4-dehydrorhamnose reductase